MRLVFFVFLAVAAHLGITPDLTDTENADVKTLAATAATHSSAQDKKVCQICRLEVRGTKIPGSAFVAMSNHHAFMLLLGPVGDRGYCEDPKP
jgi:hypothetical protein